MKADKTNPARVIALTIWGEARGEGIDGMMGVASVIWYGAKRWKRTLVGECLRPWRYSCWREEEFLQATPDEKNSIWRTCLVIAKSMVDKTFSPTLVASHYFNPAMIPGGWPKSWKRSLMTYVKTIKRHQFWMEKTA